MRLKKFLNKLDEAVITEAIHSVELDTTGKIRVFVSGRPLRKDDIMHRAAMRFKRLGLADSGQQGILLYFVPLDHRFAIFGGSNIHEHCGNTYWSQLTQRIEEFLQREEFTQAVTHAIQECGKLLVFHFPR